MIDCLAVFAAQFVHVFLLGFQSRCVRDSQYLQAVINSLGLGTCALVVLPRIAQFSLENDWSLAVAFMLAGPLAICTAIYVHDRSIQRSQPRRAQGVYICVSCGEVALKGRGNEGQAREMHCSRCGEWSVAWFEERD